MAMASKQPVSTACDGSALRVPLRVLIVEDNAVARIATHRYLQFQGYSVAAAASAEEAVRMGRELHPDVVICDWKLNGQHDGVDVARLLCSEQEVEIIFVTACPPTELRAHAPDLCDADCLRKPISLDALAAAVEIAASRGLHVH